MILRSGQGGMTAATRRISSVLLVCWLNLAILPCAMAMGGDDHCAHMKPAPEQDSAAHQGHAGSETHADCASAPSDCCELDEATLDGRGDKLKEASEDLSAFIPIASWPVYAAAPALRHKSRPPDRGGSSTPLHVLNCVYLK